MNDFNIEKNNSNYFSYFCVTFIFGVYLYEFIGIKPVDELLELGLIGLFLVSIILNRTIKFGTDILLFTATTIFYIIYSLFIKSNTLIAIATDTLIQIKPFVGFFCFYYTGIRFTTLQKIKIKWIVYLFLIFSCYAAFEGVVTGDLNAAFVKYFAHESRFGTGLILLAILYLYCTDFSWKNIFIFILILSVGLLCGKGKFFGFYAAAISLTFFIKRGISLKFNFKTMIMALVIIMVVAFAAKDKIFFYFINYDISEEHSLARPILYITSFLIFIDFFPFGSGLASFATHASGAYYSNIYYTYNLNHVWGLTPEDPMFVSDTHYPSLAQYGVVGLILFFLFWRRILKENKLLFAKSNNRKNHFLVILLTVFLMIELVADATFTYNRGFIAMVLIALLLNEMKFKPKEFI